jgi:hypothetical protein
MSRNSSTSNGKLIKIFSWILLTIVPSIFAVLFSVFAFGKSVEAQTSKIDYSEKQLKEYVLPHIDKFSDQISVHENRLNVLKEKYEENKNFIEEQTKKINDISAMMSIILTKIETQEANMNLFWSKDWKQLQTVLDRIQDKLDKK